MKRRSFLSGLSASVGVAGLAQPGWAAAGSPDFITAGNRADKSSWLVGFTREGELIFELPIPSRGHAASIHPKRPEAVAFARRPGRFAVVIECIGGHEVARLESPEGRHFYGHGAYSADGKTLFTTENNYDGPAGVIGVWDAADRYRRLGEVPAGGIGPHEILRLPDGGFVVANGGIQTYPDMARAKLNLPTMRTNLTYLTADGQIADQVELSGEMHQNSIRHIAVDGMGAVIAALQWQGNPTHKVPLVMRHMRGGKSEFLPHPDDLRLKNYAGSIAVCPQTGEIAVSGPRGNQVIYYDAHGTPAGSSRRGTASGVAPAPNGGLAITCDGGFVHRLEGTERFVAVSQDYAWDNHLISL
ncbi:DUF1513 domain-containing protein [Aliiroseovarius sp. 2305UL8-7]|uniref:DUF1513 domain-containing protein n=1 Tax=Aliiroseovarius conchicola TaxID=3121637 RepID=UPI003527B398